MNKVLNQVGKDLLQRLEKRIQKDVYDVEKTPNTVYERRNEFIKAWKKSIAKNINSKTSQITISYDPSKIDIDHHKSIVKGKTPFKVELFDKMLNVDGYTSSLMTPSGKRHVSKLRRLYWNRFINNDVKRGSLKRLIVQRAKEEGMNVL
jgi:replication initiation and membrane attachment protein DnaB